MGNRVRVLIGVVLAALIAVNLVVLLYVGPEMATEEVQPPMQPPKDWEDQHDVPEEPEIIRPFESKPVGDEPK
ncbi:MAG: hypothetical protein KAS77_13885 [Thermoplasmata archaeon]|nr:hypothetical protein [Thermoplasmata archaeon]